MTNLVGEDGENEIIFSLWGRVNFVFSTTDNSRSKMGVFNTHGMFKIAHKFGF